MLRLRRPVLYPDLYAWYVLVASLDILFTWVILHEGGQELNLLAAWIIDRHDLPGLVLFKFCTVMLVVTVCELLGRRRGELGVRLARWAVTISAFPVLVGAVHIFRLIHGVTVAA